MIITKFCLGGGGVTSYSHKNFLKKSSVVLSAWFQLGELKIPCSALANGLLSIIAECSAVLKPFLEETVSRFSVLVCRYACRRRAQPKHHKYRSIINHLQPLIHSHYFIRLLSGLIFSPVLSTGHAHDDRRNFTSSTWSNWHSDSFLARQTAFSGQLCGTLEQNSFTSKAAEANWLFQRLRGGDRWIRTVLVKCTEWLVAQLLQYFTGESVSCTSFSLKREHGGEKNKNAESEEDEQMAIRTWKQA